MVRRRPCAETLDLLAWEPPPAAVSFPPEQIRAATIAARFSRAVAQTLRDCKKDRAQIAEEMGEYLGETVSVNMLDAYASEAREDHKINLPRFAALIHATQDYRLLSVLADLFDHVVIPERFAAAVEIVALQEKADELMARKAVAVKKWKGGQ